MKTAKQLLGGLVFLLIAFQGFAIDVESNLDVAITGAKTFDLQLSNVKGRARVYLTDEQSNIYHNERLKAKGELHLTFDLSGLETGAYTLIVKDDYKIQSLPLIINSSEIKVDMNELSKVFFPQIITRGDEVFVKMLSNETNDLNIKIESGVGEVLYEEKLEGQIGLIGQKFKFLGGAYKITLTSDSYSESRYFYL